uniref:Tripartite motif containing 35 n=1 Tax=Nothobranchius furzeri TaxID=105023 RepID=A0A8C6L585_NOTFU
DSACGEPISDDDLLCPQCSGIYCLPVVLICGHNICKVCLYRFWEVRRCRNCPVCGIESSTGVPPLNLALQKRIDVFKVHAPIEESDECLLHNEKLKVFCNDDEVPICLVCQISKQHSVHQCCTVEEAVLTKKVKYKQSAKRFTQSSQVETQIKQEFQKLQKFLQDEENMRLRALKQEEETKAKVISKKIENLEEQIRLLSFTITDVDKALTLNDLPFLKVQPETIRDILINSAKHLGLLPYEVWKKMLNTINYTSVILDPNTAHSNLKLSQGLTSVQYSSKKPLPDNPERCTSRMWVLGANGFISGKHSWTVDVGQGKDWYIGVARESIKRKSAVFLSPTEGFWVIGQCSIDSLWAQTSPRTRIHVKQKPEKITIELDFIKGKVVFINSEDSSMIYTFKEKFSERIFPFFALGLEDRQNASPLTICPKFLRVEIE